MHTVMRCGAVMLFLGLSLPAAAQPACLSSPQFQVAHALRARGVGSEIVVQPLQPGQPRPCSLARQPGDFSISDPDDADYVLGLTGNILVLDQGTGPSRMLALYDLSARRVVLTRPYDEAAPVKVEAGKVTFAMITATATETNCRSFKSFSEKGLGAALVQQATVTPPKLTPVLSGPVRCIARQ